MKRKVIAAVLMSALISRPVLARSYIADGPANIRAGAGTDTAIMGQLPYGEDVDLIQYDVGNGFALVGTQYGTGYIWNQLISTEKRTEEMLAIANCYNSGTGKLIVVDTNGYPYVYVFTGSSYNWTPEAVFDCSVGRPETPTPTGVFHIQNKRDVLFSAGSDEYYVSDFAYDIYGAWCFHSTLYQKGTYNPIDDRVGCHISNGCIRMHIEDSAWIWANCGVGTTVVIV